MKILRPVFFSLSSSIELLNVYLNFGGIKMNLEATRPHYVEQQINLLFERIQCGKYFTIAGAELIFQINLPIKISMRSIYMAISNFYSIKIQNSTILKHCGIVPK